MKTFCEYSISQVNPRHYLCKRFFPELPVERNWFGDCQRWCLVVKGEEFGKMWFFTDVGIQPACPSMDFREWMEYWLNGGEDFFYGYQYDEK